MFKPALCSAALLLWPVSAFAQPETPDGPAKDTITAQELADVLADIFADHSADLGKSMARLKRDLNGAEGDLNSELNALSDAMEDAFSEDGVLREMAQMFGEFAGDFDVDSEDGVTVFKFDDKTLGRIERQTSRQSEDALSLSGLGKNMTIERETFVENGKTRTRIVIEMDGDPEVALEPSDEE